MTPLNDYMSLLLGDDDSLKAFLADPVGQSTQHHLTKAERSVLRRVVTTASTDSSNGYAVVRPLSAYRQAIRLMQNVLHHSMGAAHSNAANATNTLILYYSGNPSDPSTNPYAQHQFFYGTGSTIGELMQNIQATGQALSYADVPNNPGQYIESFTINGSVYSAPPSSNLFSDTAFWFYSINGLAGPTTIHGTKGQSYAQFAIQPGQVVYWQVIAPTVERGFDRCYVTEKNHAAGLV